jgi:hypothetical protein
MDFVPTYAPWRSPYSPPLHPTAGAARLGQSLIKWGLPRHLNSIIPWISFQPLA